MFTLLLLSTVALAIPTTLFQDNPADNVLLSNAPELAGDWKFAGAAPAPVATARSVRRWGGLPDDLVKRRSFEPDAAREIAKLAPVNLRRWGGIDRRYIRSVDQQELEKRQQQDNATRWLPTPNINVATTNRRTKSLPSYMAPSSQQQTQATKELPPSSPSTVVNANANRRTKALPPSSSAAPPSSSTPTPTPTPTPTQQASTEPSYGWTSNGYDLDGTHEGPATYYYTGLGACGWWNQDTDYITAISELIFLTWPGATANPNNNPVCGNKIRAWYGANYVDVTVVDYCVGCTNPWHLDMSPSAFQNLTTLDQGMVDINWEWL